MEMGKWFENVYKQGNTTLGEVPEPCSKEETFNEVFQILNDMKNGQMDETLLRTRLRMLL